MPIAENIQYLDFLMNSWCIARTCQAYKRGRIFIFGMFVFLLVT